MWWRRCVALQVSRELGWLYAKAGARIATCVGGMDASKERRALGQGVQIVVGTPGRLRDHLERGALDLTALRAVVLDEADEMLDMGFADELEAMLNPIHALERGEIEVPHFEEVLAGELSRRTGTPVLAEGLLARMFDEFEHAHDMNALVRRARENGIRTALLSNSWGDFYPRDLWDGMFDVVVISGEVGMRKPDAEIFHLTLERLEALNATPPARDWLAQHGFDPLMGARPMARVIQDRIKRPLADELLFGKLVNGGRVSIDVRDDELVVDAQAEPEKLLPATV